MSLADVLRAAARGPNAARDLAAHAARLPRMQHPGAAAVLREVERFAAYECTTAEERVRAWTLGVRLAEVVATALEDRTAAAVAEWLREVAGGGPGEATVPQAAALADRIERGEWREA